MPLNQLDDQGAALLPDADGRTFGWQEPNEEVASELRERYSTKPDHLFVLREQVDLRRYCPPVYDQAPFNACTVNAVAAMIHTMRNHANMQDLGIPSRLHSYWHMRLAAGTQATDAGGSVGEAVDTVFREGYCPEAIWAYVPANLSRAPPALVDGEARRHRVGRPWSPRDLSDIREALGRNQPVAFGLRLFNSFFQADLNGGRVPMPNVNDVSRKHAALIVGYDDARQILIVRNSWGLRTTSGRPCGDGGHYYLPYAYVGGNLSMDFWTLPAVTS